MVFIIILYHYSFKSIQVVAKFNDVSCSLMYDVLHDGDYRRCWDENMVECYEICQLDRYNDIGYYSSKLLVLGYSALLRTFV